MGTLDEALKAADSAAFSPPVSEPKSFTARQLDLMADDMIDRLLTNGSLIGDMIYGEVPFEDTDLGLNCSQASQLGHLISNVLTCRRADLDEHIDNLRALFSRNLHPMAKSMAAEYLENGEED
jgi:hypothetical protein